jgi:hypothetical protein
MEAWIPGGQVQGQPLLIVACDKGGQALLVQAALLHLEEVKVEVSDLRDRELLHDAFRGLGGGALGHGWQWGVVRGYEGNCLSSSVHENTFYMAQEKNTRPTKEMNAPPMPPQGSSLYLLRVADLGTLGISK